MVEFVVRLKDRNLMLGRNVCICIENRNCCFWEGVVPNVVGRPDRAADFDQAGACDRFCYLETFALGILKQHQRNKTF